MFLYISLLQPRKFQLKISHLKVLLLLFLQKPLINKIEIKLLLMF